MADSFATRLPPNELHAHLDEQAMNVRAFLHFLSPQRRATVERIVDNRVFLLGLDQLYRERMKRHESTELLTVMARQLIEDFPEESDDYIAEMMADIIEADDPDFDDTEALDIAVAFARGDAS